MLEAGDPAPAFELPDQNGETVAISDFGGQRVVVYFYPKAKTGGCTREAQAFRDAHEAYADRDVAVLGVSTDPVELIAEFADEEDLPFRLLADEDGTVTEAFGSRRDSGVADRHTYVVGPDGTIEAVYGDVSPDGHAAEVLDDIDGLASA